MKRWVLRHGIGWMLGLMLVSVGASSSVHAQGYVNQEALEAWLQPCPADFAPASRPAFFAYPMTDRRNNRVLAQNTFFKYIGDRDIPLGRERAVLVELLNRQMVMDTALGDTLIVPVDFNLPFCAYAPYPAFYEGAATFDKLFVIDKATQSFAAFEHGRLVRWGIVNTGSAETPTPNGRYNFNWRAEYRISSMSPPGQQWEMYWVLNFHLLRGIHIHQYALPTGGPTSAGCVRLVDNDAAWIYNWADTWQTSVGDRVGSERGTLYKQGTTVLVIGEDPPGAPEVFTFEGGKPHVRMVDLPADPFDVPPGTQQQVEWDRKRLGG